jgi:hypothetical protein
MTGVQIAYAELGDTSAITAALLARYEPSLRFLDGSEPSESPTDASVHTSPESVVVAVRGQADICAFGRLHATGTVGTVTVKTTGPCTAGGPPTEGWSENAAAGGAGVPLAPDALPHSASGDSGILTN